MLNPTGINLTLSPRLHSLFYAVMQVWQLQELNIIKFATKYSLSLPNQQMYVQKPNPFLIVLLDCDSLQEWILFQKLRLTKGSTYYELLQHEIVGARISMYLFNITNAESFLAGDDSKIRLEEVGPFVFQYVFDDKSYSCNVFYLVKERSVDFHNL